MFHNGLFYVYYTTICYFCDILVLSNIKNIGKLPSWYANYINSPKMN